MPRSSPVIKRPTFSPSVISVQRESSLLGAVKEGFGWGIGTSVARSLFGGSGSQQQQQVKAEPTEFERCIAEHKDDIAVCAHLAQKK